MATHWRGTGKRTPRKNTKISKGNIVGNISQDIPKVQIQETEQKPLIQTGEAHAEVINEAAAVLQNGGFNTLNDTLSNNRSTKVEGLEAEKIQQDNPGSARGF